MRPKAGVCAWRGAYGEGMSAQATPRTAVVHHPSASLDEVEAILVRAGAYGWEPFNVEGHEGTFVMPRYGVPADIFAQVLGSLGKGWMLVPDPRPLEPAAEAATEEA
jgi:hypothetical protein